jgi:membrane associated rhomboid family serine protease
MSPGVFAALWSAPQGGGILRAVTAAFASLAMHANWLHLLGNLVFLLIFGPPSERLLGPARLLMLFLVCGGVANVAGALTLGASAAPIVGASGAVSSIVGAYLALFPRSHLGLVLPLGLFLEFVRVPTAWLIGVWAVIQVLFAWIDPSFGRVAWSIHIAGFIAGIAFAFASRAAIARRQRN